MIFRALAASVTAMMGTSASAQDFPYAEWASLWEQTCGSLEAAYEVIENPRAQGWLDADPSVDENAARVIELAHINAQGLVEDAKMTKLSAFRHRTDQLNAFAAFQEFEFADQPNNFIMACVLYDFSAPQLSAKQLQLFSDEGSATNTSANGIAMVDWPQRLQDLGRFKKQAASIPKQHPGASLLVSGLVLKTQYVFSESPE